ncbi:MAG: thiamine-phosphate kinase [Candidatus Omnitrophota bacterium]|nr:thiamine-phosphate kinase [Candidatus Omnitrophota bacterium]
MRELDIIKEIRRRSGDPGKSVLIGIGDDCAVIKPDSTKYLLWASDMLVEGTHFIVKKDPYELIGRKAVAVNISDIASMGGIPKYITVSLALPRKMTDQAIGKIYDGIFGICKAYGVKVIGGDTNGSEKLVINISIIGQVEKKRLITRSGARSGDVIFITGPVRSGKKAHLTFVPRLKEARYLTARYSISAMIDTSDGIALDISRICAESDTGCVIQEEKIPLSDGLKLKDALFYGESFELLFTMTENSADVFRSKRDDKRTGCYEIGRITSRRNGLKLSCRDGKNKMLEENGFKHI